MRTCRRCGEDTPNLVHCDRCRAKIAAARAKERARAGALSATRTCRRAGCPNRPRKTAEFCCNECAVAHRHATGADIFTVGGALAARRMRKGGAS